MDIQKTQTLVEMLRASMIDMPPRKRLELVDVLMQGYCRECGFDDPDYSCQCWNDE